MLPRRQRLLVVGVAVLAAGLAVYLASEGLSRSVAYFQTPSDIAAAPPSEGQALSVGGLVALGSVRQDDGALAFQLVDDGAALEVRYAGVVPNLFREGQCVIAQGVYAPDAPFVARRVLAKHDESYTPREIAEAPSLARSCGDAAGEAALAAGSREGAS